MVMGWDYHIYMRQPEWFIIAVEDVVKRMQENKK